MPFVVALRERPDLCPFFAERLEAEWPEWYGPGDRGDATADLRDFANPAGVLPATAVSLLEREGWTRIDAVSHEGGKLYIFRARVPKSSVPKR